MLVPLEGCADAVATLPDLRPSEMGSPANDVPNLGSLRSQEPRRPKHRYCFIELDLPVSSK